MSYPNGPSGPQGGNYGPPQQGGSAFGRAPAAPNPLAGLGLPGLLTLAILVLGLVAYFCSFGGGGGLEVDLLLAGGLLAGLSLLPSGPRLEPIAAVLSVTGGLAILANVIAASAGGLPTAVILILVFGLVQAAVSVFVVLLDYGVIKMAPQQAVPHSGPTYPTGGGYQGGGPQDPGAQGTTYMTPPQSTQFMQHPGQLGHPPNRPGNE